MSNDDVKEMNLKQGKKLVIVVLTLLYTAINQLFTGLDISSNLNTDDMNVGLFVTATGAIIFGRGAAGAAAGAGEILQELQKMLAGEGSALHLGTLMSAASLGIGTWLTGFLGRSKQTLPENFTGIIFSKKQIKKLGNDTTAALIGTSLTSNLLYVFGSQLQEGASLAGGVPIFVSRFLEDSIVIILFVPATLIMYDILQVFNKNKERILEKLLRKIDVDIPINDSGIDSIDVSLPQRSLIIGLWTPVILKFVNTRKDATIFSMEAVSTSKIYPHKDKTKKLEPGESWTQTFFVLPSKQEEVDIRMRVIPEINKEFKKAIKEESIIEFTAGTRSQSSIISSLLGFSGVNGVVLGGAMIWDKILQFFADYQTILNQIKQSSELMITTTLVEIGLFIPLLGGMYWKQKKAISKAPLKLSFSDDIEDQTYDEIITRKFEEYIRRFKPKLAPLSKFSVYIVGMVTFVLLSREGILILLDPTHTTENPELILYSVVVLLVTWTLGFRGTELLKELGLLDRDPFEFKEGSVITKFKPLGQFQEGIPTEVVVLAKNPSQLNGIRIKLEGYDTISPNIVELHIAPNETAQFKIAVTPIKKATQDILALVYHLFDEDGEYINFDEAEPFERQDLSYEVVGQTSLGVTKKQQDTLKKFGGLGGVITGSLLFINQFIGIPNLETVIKENAPFIAALQAPFVYAYFSISNRLKQIKK